MKNEVLQNAIYEGPGTDAWEEAKQIFSFELLGAKRRLFTGEWDPEEVPFWFGGTLHK